MNAADMADEGCVAADVMRIVACVPVAIARRQRAGPSSLKTN